MRNCPTCQAKTDKRQCQSCKTDLQLLWRVENAVRQRLHSCQRALENKDPKTAYREAQRAWSLQHSPQTQLALRAATVAYGLQAT